MLTTLFFDLDDTLLDFKGGESIAIRQTLAQAGIAPTDEMAALYSAINQSQWELLEEGKLTRDQVLLRRFDILFARLGIQGDSKKTQAVYENLLAQQHPFLPGALELLETLYPKYPLYLVSNGTAAVQDQRLRDSDLSRFFQKIFISERVGADKPSKEFFDRCFAQIPGFSPDQGLIIGDSLTSDMRGGNNAGLHTCWFNPKKKPRRGDISVEFEIRELSELLEILEQV